MPFTPTHALVAVPLSRVPGLPASALAIGCMLPDLPLFLPGTPPYHVTHSLALGPLYCMAYGIAAFVLFRVCRGPVLSLAPEGARQRLAGYARPALRLSPGEALGVAASLVLGIWSHIAWDGFTHPGLFGSVLFPALAEPWLEVAGRTVPGTKLLQIGSSLVGLPLLAALIVRWYGRQSAARHAELPPAPRWLSLWALGLAAATPLAASWLSYQRAALVPERFWEGLAFHGVTLTTAGYLAGVVLVSVLHRAFVRA